jgi:hypothetical protein
MKSLLVLIALAFYCGSALAQKPIEVPVTEVHQHRLASQPFLPIKPLGDDSFQFYVRIEITVGPDGTVISAVPRDGDAQYYDATAHAALDWKYKPFERNGRAITVSFSEYVRVVPTERRPAEHVPFPEIKDWNSLRITLERIGGSDYALELRGNGAVRYVGRWLVEYCGEWRGEVPLDSIRELVAQFKATDYFSLFPSYEYKETDHPTSRSSIEFDDKNMSVTDYVGPGAGMPLSVLDLEDAIDRIGDPEHWLTHRLVPPEVDNCMPFVPTQKVHLPETIPPPPVTKP